MKNRLFPLLAVACLSLTLGGEASAQSSPGLKFGQIPTAAQWNSYFSAKQDVLIAAPSSVLGNPSGAAASPIWLSVPNCGSSNQAVTYTANSGFGCNNFVITGNVSGPGSSTVGYAPVWGNTAGTGLLAGLPVATSGANTIVETTSGGPVLTSVIPVGKSVADPGTGALEALLPIQTVTGASKAFSTVDLQLETRRSNSGSAMTDGFPASSTQGMVNGTEITVNNFDAAATDMISAGAGTTITIGGISSGSYAHPPGRSIRYVYDAPATTWRATLNTSTALLSPNNLSDLLSASTARTNLGLGTAATINVPVSAANGGSGEAGTVTGALKGNGTSAYTQAACADLTNGATGCSTAVGTAATVNTGTSGATIPLNNTNNTSSGNQTHTGTENFTGGLQIGGTAVTLPVPVAIGGTGATTAWQARNALCPARPIASGTSDTATTSDCVVIWNSSTASAKTQGIPACTSGNSGFDITIVDGLGTASGVLPITVTPSSGTILLGASAPINATFSWLHLRCDGGSTNYVEIG